MRELELERAIEILEEADRSSAVTASARLEALLLLVECRVALEQLDDARSSARRMLELDPSFVAREDGVDGGIPRRVLRLLEAARADHPTPVDVLFEPPVLGRRAATGRTTLEVAVVQGLDAVDRVVFDVDAGRGPERTVADRAAERFRVALDVPAGANRTIRVRILALAPSGALRGELGPVALPLPTGELAAAAPPPAPSPIDEGAGGALRHADEPERSERSSLLGNAWLWVGIGALVTGVAAAILVLGKTTCDESLEPGGTICLN
jgi:hypothetical protein